MTHLIRQETFDWYKRCSKATFAGYHILTVTWARRISTIIRKVMITSTISVEVKDKKSMLVIFDIGTLIL